MGCFAPGTGGALYVWVLLIRVLKLAGGTDTQPPETVVLGMSGRRAGSVFARDRCDREE